MPTFSYLHITDLHLSLEPKRKNAPYLLKRPWKEIIDTVADQPEDLGFSSFFLPVSYDPEIARGVAQFCLEWSQAVDGLIITGDLATTGLTIDVAVAEKFIKAPALSSFVSDGRLPTLAAANVPIRIFAGNHDRYVNNRGKPFSNHFDFVFEDYMNKKREYIGSWVDEKEGARLAFVHADFTLRTRAEAKFPSPIYAYGQGRVYEDVLDDLRAETFAIRNDCGDVPVVWMVHFAPYECGSQLELIDHQRLINAANALGVLAILCGHTHESISKKFDDLVIYCGGSACCIDNVGGCKAHVVDFVLDDGQITISRSTFEWDEDETEFVHFKDD